MRCPSPGLPFLRVLGLTLAAWLLASSPALWARSDPDTRGSLTPGLELVSPDGPGFATVCVAELWKSPSTKELRDLLAKAAPNFQEEFQKHVGVGLAQIERVTIILPPDTHRTPAVVVTTSKALDKETVRKAVMSQGEEKQVGGKTVYANKAGREALYFPGDRVFVVAPLQDLETIVKTKPRPNQTGPLSGSLALAAGQHQLVVGLNLAHPFFQKAAKQLPQEAKFLEPLFSARKGEVLIVSDATSRGTLRLTFADENRAREAREALEKGRAFILKGVAQGKKEIERQNHRPLNHPAQKFLMQKALALLDQVKEGAQGATVKTMNGKQVVVTVKMKASAGDLITAVGGSMVFYLSVSEPRPAPAPANVPPAPNVKP